MKQLLHSLLALALFTTACKKEKTELEKLPAATQTGTGAGAFLLDGKAWLPDGGGGLIGGGGNGFKAKWSRTTVGRALELTFTRASDKTGLNLFVPNIRKEGLFQLSQPASPTLGDRNPPYGLYYMAKSLTVPRIFLTGPSTTGTLIVTRFDTVARVVSGTFDLTVKEETGPETHQLTHGRFDYTF